MTARMASPSRTFSQREGRRAEARNGARLPQVQNRQRELAMIVVSCTFLFSYLLLINKQTIILCKFRLVATSRTGAAAGRKVSAPTSLEQIEEDIEESYLGNVNDSAFIPSDAVTEHDGDDDFEAEIEDIEDDPSDIEDNTKKSRFHIHYIATVDKTDTPFTVTSTAPFEYLKDAVVTTLGLQSRWDFGRLKWKLYANGKPIKKGMDNFTLLDSDDHYKHMTSTVEIERKADLTSRQKWKDKMNSGKPGRKPKEPDMRQLIVRLDHEPPARAKVSFL